MDLNVVARPRNEGDMAPPTSTSARLALPLATLALGGLILATLAASCGGADPAGDPGPLGEAAAGITAAPHDGTGTLLPGAVCTASGDCASDSCRGGHCCAGACCGGCGDTATCDATGACQHFLHPPSCNCQQCGGYDPAHPVAIQGTCTCDGCSCPGPGELEGNACAYGAGVIGACQGGLCKDSPLPNGSPCADDGGCVSGHCVASMCCDVSCGPLCTTCSKVAGAVADGTCTQLGDGLLCGNTGDACLAATCQAGACVTAPVTCATGPCTEPATCTPGIGCSPAPKPDGTACPGGTCTAGVCHPTADAGGGGAGTSSGGGGGASASSSSGGTSSTSTSTSSGATTSGGGGAAGASSGPGVGSTSGCAVGAGADQGWAWAALAALGLVGRRRRSQASAR